MPRVTAPTTAGGRSGGYIYDPAGQRPERGLFSEPLPGPTGDQPWFADPQIPNWMKSIRAWEEKRGKKIPQKMWAEISFKERLKGMNDFKGFWFTLQQKMDQIGPWQARFFLRYIFRQPAGKEGEMGFIPGRDIKMGQPYKGIITGLASKAAAAGGTPAGWRGLESLMFKTPTSGWNPYGSKKGLATAVISGDIYSPSIDRFGRVQGPTSTTGTKVTSTDPYHPIRQFMDKWELTNPGDLDTFAPVYMNMWQREHQANLRKVEAERKRGGPGIAERALMGKAAQLVPQALGGTLFAGGAEIAKAAGPEHSFLYGLGDVTQSLGAEMFAGGAGYYPKYSGMGLDPERYDPSNIQKWEGPRTAAGRAITGAGQGFRQLTGGQPQMPFYDPEEERRKEEERKRLEEFMIPYRWDEEPWRFKPRGHRWGGY